MTPKNFTDLTFTTLLSLTPFYSGGWGNPSVVEAVQTRFMDPGDPAAIDVRWHREKVVRGASIREGYFESPTPVAMPPETRTAWFLMMLPPHSPENPPPVCVQLAATADTGYRHRKRLADRLLRLGIGSVILENPYYGKRRPRRQLGVALGRLSDQLVMNYATIEEARGLLRWLRERGFPQVGVTGYSMGGFMSAYTAALQPHPIAAIPCAAGVSPGFTFTQTEMNRVPNWKALGRDVDAPKEAFSELLDALRIDRLPAPADPESAIIVAARSDSIVPPEQSVRLHRHWKGSRLRWMGGGHIVGFIGHLGFIAETVADAFAIRIAKDER